ncbi:MAG: hypothetical protein WHS86_13775 [Desulfosoma sp.]
MFPHPFQMALMGYWINECHHRDAAEYVARVEAYARRLEQKLEAALRGRAEWEKYGRHMEAQAAMMAQGVETFRREAEWLAEAFQEIQREVEEQQRAAEEKVRSLESAVGRWIEKHQSLARDAAKLKAFLQDFFGEHATKLLTPLGLRHRERVLRFIQRLPDDPGDAPGS